MSINWVMLSETEGFAALPGEQRLFQSAPRTALSVQTLNKYPGKEPFHIDSSSGVVYLTNRRIIYLPSTSTPTLQSFAAPILNLHDTHVTTPWFGPNTWTALVQPVAGGGIPPQHAALELKITFKEGGAFDFHTKYERVKERLQQAVEAARESGQSGGDGTEASGGRGGGALSGVNLDSVHLDELPAYEADAVPGTSVPPGSPPLLDADIIERVISPDGTPAARQEPFTPPSEPPPGYEEVQRDSVAGELERRLRQDGSS